MTEKLLPRYAGRVSIHGYTENLEQYLLSSDMLITRAGPNILMEAVTCCIPVVTVGALPGQEEGNPGYMVQYGLGMECKRLELLPEVIEKLLENDRRKLWELRKNQWDYRNPKAANEIVEFIANTVINADKEHINETGKGIL